MKIGIVPPLILIKECDSLPITYWDKGVSDVQKSNHWYSCSAVTGCGNTRKLYEFIKGQS